MRRREIGEPRASSCTPGVSTGPLASRKRRDQRSRGLFRAPSSGVADVDQRLLKLGSPGVPDPDQGTEHEVYTLVDPDNRAPLDPGLLHGANSAQTPKLALTRIAQALRRRLPRVFASGPYRPSAVEGPEQDCLIACARDFEEETVVIAVPRFPGRRVSSHAREFWRDVWIEWPSNAL